MLKGKKDTFAQTSQQNSTTPLERACRIVNKQKKSEPAHININESGHKTSCTQERRNGEESLRSTNIFIAARLVA